MGKALHRRQQGVAQVVPAAGMVAGHQVLHAVAAELGADGGGVLEALEGLFAFTADFWLCQGLADSLRQPVDFVLEGLFTDMVKYGGRRLPIEVTLRVMPDGVEGVAEDPAADPFDPTAAPAVDVTRPAGEREPGGLGLHLIRRMVDSIEHRCIAASLHRCIAAYRHSRIHFTKRDPPPPPGAELTEDRHAADVPWTPKGVW